MEFNYAYVGESTIESDVAQTALSFSPDTLRPPTFFSGELRHSVAFREAISALHEVVVSDLRFRPKDRTKYLQWRAQQDEAEWAMVAAQQKTVARQIEQIQRELTQLRQGRAERMKPYYRARDEYFRFLYDVARDLWFVLDPVITVHPDELFFECFSQDESTYGRLGVGYEVFENVGEFSCGTTNIDYSSRLFDEFQKIRSYKTTRFEVDPTGFEVQTSGHPQYKEVKIDLPDSWVRGFLQVSSAMALPAIQLDLHPMDLHNICFALRRKKELFGPRAMRFQLRPNEPVSIVFEPWEWVVPCPRSVYRGDSQQEIRVWGRRRIHTLERLIPIARKFTVHLLGSGMPSFYVADLGHMSFTLGLSGWTTNDWAGAANFDLLAPRADVDQVSAGRVFDALRNHYRATPDQLASELDMERASVLGALAMYTQAGRTIWDLEQGVYRLRELSRQPLPLDQLRYANEREQAAARFLHDGAVRIRDIASGEKNIVSLQGTVAEKKKGHEASLTIDADQRVTDASCSCNWHQQNRLRKGPCEHILALRLQYHQRVNRSLVQMN